jgi:hypothetical protein
MDTANKLFGRAAFYLTVIDAITPIALSHEYSFFSDEWFAEWAKTENFTVEGANSVLALELVDKAHLAAVTALERFPIRLTRKLQGSWPESALDSMFVAFPIGKPVSTFPGNALMRAKRWADAICLMYDNPNFVGWAASVRGLLEGAGDTVDGLLNISPTLAEHHRTIRRCLAGEERENFVGYSELEAKLDHFVHARWIRTKRGEETPLKAKDNATYVGILETAVPGILKLYHKLCAICHPSSESISYFYDYSPQDGGRLRLAPANDKNAIAAVCDEHPTALADALMMCCNAPLYTLRVLHKFRIHPKLAILNKLDWEQIKMGAEIERHLKG